MEHEWRTIKMLELLPSSTPAWLGALDSLASLDSLGSEGTLCIEVINRRGANVPVLHCQRIDTEARAFDLSGIFLSTSRLAQFLAGLNQAEVPPQGLTLGVLLDEQGRPAEGYRIETSPAEPVQYLSTNGQVVPGAIATTSSGLFASLDAPYDSDFRAYLGVTEQAAGLGGRVNGKVTVVVLQLGQGVAPVSGRAAAAAR